MSAIGYLVSDYHAPSHTFVRREVEALRGLGEVIVPFSIRGSAPDDAEDVPGVLNQSVWCHLRSVVGHLARRPGRLFGVWRKALAHRPPGWRGLLWSQFHFVEAATLSAMLLDRRVTHLHSHFANSGATVGMLAAELSRIDWSLTLHGISETDYPAGLLLPEKLAAARFTAIASLFMRAQAMRVTPSALWERFHIVRCGIDPAAMPPKGRPSPSEATGRRIVCVGRLAPEKGYTVLAEALAMLAEEGRRFSLQIVGDGPARSEVEQAFAAAGLCDGVHFQGALPEVETLREIARADLLVLPSLMEGLPVGLMEAMAIGVPVVASRVAGIPELVEDGVTGLTVTPSDAQALARAIARLAEDMPLAKACAAAGKRRVMDEFTIAHNAHRMQALFRREPQP